LYAQFFTKEGIEKSADIKIEEKELMKMLRVHRSGTNRRYNMHYPEQRRKNREAGWGQPLQDLCENGTTNHNFAYKHFIEATADESLEEVKCTTEVILCLAFVLRVDGLAENSCHAHTTVIF
jgi:predicted ATP-binding protein involved in virulence